MSKITKIGLPPGGSTGEVLTKKTGTNYDVEWSTGGGGGSGTVTSVATTSPITGGTITTTGTIGITQATTSTDGYLSSTDWNTFNGKQNALTNPVTGTGTSGRIAYWNGTSTQTGSSTFTFSPTAQLLVNNSVTASGAIARGLNHTPSLTAAANNDVLVGLEVNPTFTNGAFTGVSNLALRVTGSQQISGTNALRILASDGSFGKGGWIYSGSLGGGMLVLSTNIDENNTIQNPGFYSTRLQTYSSNARLEFLTSVSVGSTSLPASFVVSNVWIATSSERAGILYNGYFQPTSGTANISAISMQPVINMTGTYSGVVRGYYYNPTLTSLTGVTHVGFENTTGVNRFNTTSGNTLIGTTTDSGFKLDVNGTARVQDNLTISDAKNIILGTTTGTKIGTATTQKIGFFNATPVVQPSAVTTAQGIADALNSLGLLASSTIAGGESVGSKLYLFNSY